MALSLEVIHEDLQQMRAEFSSRFEKVEHNIAELSQRTDRIILQLDSHIKYTDHRFRAIDYRFEQIDLRFEEIDRRFDLVGKQITQVKDEIINTLVPYFGRLDRLLDTYDRRITALEQRCH